MKCAVIATSTGSLDELSSLDELVYILRLNVVMDGLVHTDGSDLMAEDFYTWQAENPGDTAVTSPPSEATVRALFRQIRDAGYREIIVTTLSGRISDTVNTVRKVAAETARDIQTYIVDTGTACIAEGHFALEAVKLLRQGFAAADVVEHLERLKPTAEIVFSVGSRERLHKLYHLKATEKLLAGIFDLKPVLRFYDGQFSRINRIRTSGDTIDTLVETVSAKTKQGNIRLYGLYGGSRDLYDSLAERLRRHTGIEPEAFPISPVIGAHIGPDAVGVVMIDKML